MFDHKETPSQPDDSLEQITTKNSGGMTRRAAIVGLLGLAGCGAPGFRDLLDRDKPHAKEMENHEFGGSAEDFSKQNIQEIIKAVKLDPYETPAVLKTAVKNNFRASGDEDVYKAFSELELQNQYLTDLFNSAKIRRYALKSVKRNVDYDGLEQYAKLSQRDVEKLEKVLGDLNVSLRRLENPKRQKLDKMFGKNKQFQEMAKYNKASLESLNKLLISAADMDTLEGNLTRVVDSNAYSSEIQKSLTGLDQSDEDKGRGKKLLDKLLDDYEFGQIVSPDTDVADAYSDKGNSKVREVYDDLLSKIAKEAKSWDGEESLHTVCNDHLGKMLEITKEAYVHGKFGKVGKSATLAERAQANEYFQAVNRTVTKQALDEVRDNLNTERGLSILYDVGLPILPGYGLVSALINANRALSKDDCEPEAEDPVAAHAELLRKGKNIKYGFATRDFIAGTNYTAQVRFYSGTLSTALYIGGLFLWNASRKDSSSSGGSAGSTQQVEIVGGETGSPGTGPR